MCDELLMQVAILVSGNYVDAGKGSGKERLKPNVAIENTIDSALDYFGNHSREHDLVTHSLLSPNQQPAGEQLFSCPKRLRVVSHLRVVIDGTPALLIIHPPRRKISMSQLRERRIKADLRITGLEAYGSSKMRERFLRPAQISEYPAQIMVGLGVVRIDGQRSLITSLGVRKPVLALAGIA